MSEKDPSATQGEPAEREQKESERDGGRSRGPSKSGLGLLFGAIMRRGRSELERAAAQGRVLLDLRQLRSDREVMYAKVGRETRSLLEGGEIQHPGLERSVARIIEIEKKIADVEAAMVSAGLSVEADEAR